MTQALTDNVPRFRPGTHHVESWFFRANHPTRPQALWIKFTIFGEKGGSALAETWCSLFDGDRRVAIKETSAWSEVDFSASGDSLKTPAAHASMGAREGSSRGKLRGPAGEVSWDLRWTVPEGPLAAPLCLFPSRKLLGARLPKNKLLTPFPLLVMSGSLTWDGELVPVESWLGMQGHNWGPAHAPEYVWGQTIFADNDGAPSAIVEGASARIRVAGMLSPRMSLLTVRTPEAEYRFDRIVDRWNQQAVVEFPRWDLTMRGAAGEARLQMDGTPERMVCLGYQNPGAKLSYCLNSKTAVVTLEVKPHRGEPFTLHSAHGGALEFLQPTPEPRVGDPC